MAEIRAFRGFTYDLGRVGALSDVVAPPYDVVDAALQRRLYDASEFNAIRLELTKDEPGDGEQNNRYTRAAATLNEWRFNDVIKQDSQRCLYAIEQEFTVEGRTLKRRGFMARVRLEPFGQGRIYPHEETMSGPKEDRLKLYRATGMNLSPIFGLYPDPNNDVFAPLESILIKQPPIEATDHLGVVSRMWRIYDEAIVSQVMGLMGPKPVFIADGHHRYETGVKYAEEKRQAGEAPTDDSPSNFIMMMLVSMSDPGLVILPTHRLVTGFAGLDTGRLTDSLSPHFHFEKVANIDDAWERIQLEGSQNILGFHTKADDAWHIARFVAPQQMEMHEPDHSAVWRELGVAILHVLALDRYLPSTVGGKGKCRYVHLIDEVKEAIAKGEPDLSVLVPPATMEHVELIAGNNEKMPPKSTYFYPKLLTGMVFNSLKTN